MRLSASVRFAAFFTFTVLFTGCSIAPSISPGVASNAHISGRVHGGQQPISGATIQLYTVGISGDGSASNPLLTQTVTSAADGTFSITSLYSCSSASLVYLTATGGNPGLSSVNPNIALMTALGPCSGLTSSTFISVNELTTVAAVYALAPYMSSLTAVGSSASDASALTAAFTLANEFVNSTSGFSPGTGIPAGTSIPSATINTLGDVIASCINSAGGVAGDSSLCGQLFSYTIPGNAPAPTNTIASLLYLANNPTLNTSLLFGLITPTEPFQPGLSTAPSDFRISAIPSTPAALQIAPSSLTFPLGSIGVTSSPQSITIQDTSTAAVNLSGLSLVGANAADFSTSNTCPTTLQPSDSCTAQVAITPSAPGARIAYLAIGSNTTSSPQYVTLAVNNPFPVISGLSPSALQSGSNSPTAILLFGSNLLPSSVVQVGGTNRSTSYISSTQVSFQLTVADQAAPSNLSVTVVNPAPSGGISASKTLTVIAPAGTPTISQTFPAQFTAGSASTSIEIVGNHLAPGETVQWNGTNLPTGYGFSSTYGYYLVATVSANLLTATGTAFVTVDNASATPPLSNTISVPIVNPPPPTLTSLSSTLVPTNTSTPLALSGTGFTPATTVAVNGVTIPSTYLNINQIAVSLPASAVLTPGVDAITVSNSSGTSAPLYLTVYVPIINNNMIYNPVNGLFYLSVPSAAGAPYGNSVVSVDPLTGALGTPIPVGSEPDKLAITSDGRYLWVGLDGSSAVRKVDLVAGVAGLEFSLPQEGTGQYAAAALAALPGATDSVVVATPAGNIGQALAIYDSGVVRGTPLQATFYTYNPWALFVDGTKNEIYAAGSNTYDTYTYDSSGLTLKTANPSNQSNLTQSYANQNNDEVEIVNGLVYTDFGQVDDPESGNLLNNFYSTGTTLAQGSTAIDTTLGKAFILEGSSGASNGFTGTIGSSPAQLASFNTADFTPTQAAPIAISIPTYRATYQILGQSGSRLTRWGSNGVAFRGTGGFVSLRTSMVQDLSAVDADLSVTITPAGTNATGNITTYTATFTNYGPSPASRVNLTAFIPSSGVLTSVTPLAGSCSTTGIIVCDLGGLSNGSSANVVFNILQASAGSATMTVQVNASETDPVPSNNQATSTINITGGTYNLAPTLSAISPAAIVSGSSDTIITLTGSGFSSFSAVLLNGATLPTSFTSSTQLTATVPSANLATLGWAPISVSNPAPGGGTASALPLTVFSVLNLGANHILYDPYSRKIMAGVGAGSSTVAGNSLVAITPDTASIGTPVPIGGTPTNLALSSDGQILYALLPSSNTGSIARFNMLTQQADFTVWGFQATGYNVGLRDIATLPGVENTVAIDEGEYPGISLFDVDPNTKTAVRRGAATGVYTGTCLAFPNASSMLATDLYTSPSGLGVFGVTSGGLVNESHALGSVMQNLNCYKLSGGQLFTQAGGVANAAVSPVVQVGVFQGMPNISNYGVGVKDFDPDASLGLSFYLTDSNPNLYSGIFDSITAFNNQTFMPNTVLPLPLQTFEGNTSFTGVDVVRWGEDGLAILTSGGNVYLVRGAAIVPQLLGVNSAAVLTASSLSSANAGTGNISLTLTGSNFVPGVAVLWNSSYRTTTIIDATHITVAIPASDLATAGTASLSAVNPGASPSGSLSFTIN
jgi:hypothetical protein